MIKIIDNVCYNSKYTYGTSITCVKYDEQLINTPMEGVTQNQEGGETLTAIKIYIVIDIIIYMV